MDLAYGMTIHKSQGSEFANVIVVMPMEPRSMLVKTCFTQQSQERKRKSISSMRGLQWKRPLKQTVLQKETQRCWRSFMKH